MTQEDKYYPPAGRWLCQHPDKVYALYNQHTDTYTDQDIQHDADRVQMLDDLWFIGFSSALLWKTEHPGYTGEEEAATQDKYYKLVFEAFWGIA